MTRVVPAVVTAMISLIGCGFLAPAADARVLRGAPASAAMATRAQTGGEVPKARLAGARTFAFALGAKLTTQNTTRLSRRDLVVVDGEEATAAQVRRIQRRGAVVLGYLSVGTVESWRSWFPLLENHRLGALGDWDGERYTDVSDAEARDALADTIAPALLSKGFDGLFLDNVDMVEDHPAQAAGMLDLVTRIAARVHGGGGVLMAQNGDGIIRPYLPLLDAWNREDPTGTYDFEHARYTLTDAPGRILARATLRTVRAAGVVTTTTDYFSSATTKRARRAIRNACAVGAIPTIADIALAKVPRSATRCP